jgi:ribosomal protein L39E
LIYTVVILCLYFRYESKGKQFVKNQPKYPVGFFPEVVNATKTKKEKADRVASENRPIPGLVIVSTPEGIHYLSLALSRIPLYYSMFVGSG